MRITFYGHISLAEKSLWILSRCSISIVAENSIRSLYAGVLGIQKEDSDVSSAKRRHSPLR